MVYEIAEKKFSQNLSLKRTKALNKVKYILSDPRQETVNNLRLVQNEVPENT